MAQSFLTVLRRLRTSAMEDFFIFYFFYALTIFAEMTGHGCLTGL